MGRRRYVRIRGAVSTLGSVGALAVASVLAASCQAPTELTLSITTDAQCGVEVKSTAIYVAQSASNADGNVQGRSPIAQTDTCASGTIGTLVVTPGGDEGAVVIIAGFDGKSPTDCVEGNYVNCIIARRSFSFIKHTPLTIPVVLERDCLNVPCDAFSTCHNGSCYSSSVDCTGGSCNAVGSNDAGPVDAGPGSILQSDGAPEQFPEAGGSDGSSLGDGGDGGNSGGNDGGDSGLADDAGGGDAGTIPPGLSCVPNGGNPVVEGCGGPLIACSSTMACVVPTSGAANGTCQMSPFHTLPGDIKVCCDDTECSGGHCCGGPVDPGFVPFAQCSNHANGTLGICGP